MTQTVLLSPEEMSASILDQLAWDDRVEAGDINVEVIGTTARLTGTVPSYADKRYAQIDAMQISGIMAVENQLVVEYPSYIGIPSDPDIQSNIKTILALHRNIPLSRIRIDVHEGVVLLEGSVDSQVQKEKVEELAADVSGVMDIRNDLAIVPTETYQDEGIAKSIIAAFIRNTSINMNDINISVANGIVTLSGVVHDWMTRRAAEEIAFFTGGVTSVNNRLIVRVGE